MRLRKSRKQEQKKNSRRSVGREALNQKQAKRCEARLGRGMIKISIHFPRGLTHQAPLRPPRYVIYRTMVAHCLACGLFSPGSPYSYFLLGETSGSASNSAAAVLSPRRARPHPRADSHSSNSPGGVQPPTSTANFTSL